LAQGTIFREAYIDAIRGNVHAVNDERLFPPAKLEEAVDHAVRRYNKDGPRVIPATVSGDGTQEYATPTGWVVGKSFIDSIEYPKGNNPPTLLDKDDDFYVYDNSETVQVIRFLPTPQTGEEFVVRFTGIHAVTATTSTVPDEDFPAVVALGTGFACRLAAAFFAQSRDGTIQADIIDYGQKADQWVALANHWFAEYANMMGIGDDAMVTAADDFVDWDVLRPDGSDYLLHKHYQR
jgi:hypothetical protein